MDKTKQKSTELTLVTGLTPQQEQAAMLLASGESVTDVASVVNVNRATIYLWQQKINFKCFYNQQCKIIQDNIKNGLCGLYDEALQAIRSSLQSNNDLLRLKAAVYVISKVEMIDSSQRNPEQVIRRLCTHTESAVDWNDLQREVFDEEKYKEMMKDNGLM